jgi:hypothetical protein
LRSVAASGVAGLAGMESVQRMDIVRTFLRKVRAAGRGCDNTRRPNFLHGW